MKTGSWMTYKGLGRVGISLGAPRGQPAGFRLYRTLAPTRDMLHMAKDEYVPRYAEILAKLDPKKTWDEIHALAGGAEPVILCFERPPFTVTNFCHRRLVADWFERELGQLVPEVEVTAYA